MARPTRPKGYLTKGKTKSADAARKASARRELTSLKGIAGIVGKSIIEGVGGPKAKAAKTVVRAGKKALSGKVLDDAINKANASARSTKPVRNTKGLKTTTGQGRKKTSNIEATRVAEESAGPKARRLGGESALRTTTPKPGVRLTTKIGKYRGYGTLSKEKTKVSKPVRFDTNKKGSAVTITKTQPRKAAEVREEIAKKRRDRLRNALTPRINPARPKVQPKRGNQNSTQNNTREEELINRYYRIRFGDKNAPTTKGAQEKQESIESRIASGSEKPTRGKSSSNFDKEAEARINEALNTKSRIKAKVKPGVPTRTTTLLKSKAKPSEIKGAIRNQRKVLRNREIKEAVEKMRKAKEAAERIRKAEETAKKRGSK